MIAQETEKTIFMIRRASVRGTFVFGGGIFVLILLMFASLTLGEADITIGTVVEALINPHATSDHQMVLGVRFPRAVIGVLAGAALAVSGALLQTVTRNPLASASTLGVNAGAYFIIVFATVFFPVWTAEIPLLLGFIGACGAVAASFLLAGGRKSTPVRMALAGMIVSFVLSSFTSALQLLFEDETRGLFVWGSGSLVQNDWSGVQYCWPWITFGIAVVLFFSRTLDLLELGEETARSLGQRINAVRIGGLGAAALLAAVTVSVVGPIGFVGLIAPHLVRLVGFRRHLTLLPASAIWGAVILAGADIIVRLVRSQVGELPVGAVTAAIGAPWLIWLTIHMVRNHQSTEGSSSMSIGLVRSKAPYLLWVAIGTITLLTMLIFGLMAGGMKLPFGEVWMVLTGGGSELTQNIVLHLRLPRILVAALAGASLAVAGLMLQGSVRNPLADPSVIGVTSGAGVGALILLVVWPDAPGSLLPAAAFAGAVAAAGAVYLLAWRKSFQPVVVTLIGIAVSAVGSAGIQFLLIKAKFTAAPALAWLSGTTYARGWDEFLVLAISSVILFPLAWWLGRRVDLLAFGDQVSLGLGLRLQLIRLSTAAIGVALAAVSVATVGTVGFIGLLAPHAIRFLVGQNQRQSVLLCAVLGALLLVGADMIGKTVLAPKEIPAGLVVALLGTPYLLLIMYRSRLK